MLLLVAAKACFAARLAESFLVGRKVKVVRSHGGRYNTVEKTFWGPPYIGRHARDTLCFEAEQVGVLTAVLVRGFITPVKRHRLHTLETSTLAKGTASFLLYLYPNFEDRR